MASRVHIIASPFKTGTSSIAAALSILGVAYAPMGYRGDLLAASQPDIRKANRLARRVDFALATGGEFSSNMQALLGGVVSQARGFDIFHDAPIGHSHIHPLALKTVLPSAKFIWVKRPKFDWLQSVEAWETSHPKTYPNHRKWHTDRDEMIAQKMRRRQQARRDFSKLRKVYPNDTLILNWSDLGGFEKLAHFYGVDPPNTVFPHENRNDVAVIKY